MTSAQVIGSTRRHARQRLSNLAIALGLLYFVLLGGTSATEGMPNAQVLNAALAAIFVVTYVWTGPRLSDRVDQLTLVALLLFLATAVTSAFPRQSFDAALSALAYAALFFVARGLSAKPSTGRTVVLAMRAATVIVLLIAGSRLVGSALHWVELTGTAPPVGLPLVAYPWGHAYDQMTLAVMLFPSWLTRPIGTTRAAVATVIAIVLGAVVILLGGRALWLAIVVASLLLLAPRAAPWFKAQTSAIRITLVFITAAATFAMAALGGSLVDRLLTSSTIGQRLSMWSAALEAWLERPLHGYGPGAFPWILQTTSYFDTNSIHPRHPDSVPFQLLPEAGLLGVAAAGIILIAIGWAMWRRRSLLALWPVAVFVLSGIGANPTDFPYLVVIALVWAGLALPRTRDPAPGLPAWPLWRPISSVGLALMGTATVLTLAASISYQSAEERADAGDIRAAREQLGVAIALDPGMGLYIRERGVANLILDKPRRATADLRKATQINPSDDLASRLLSIALDADHRPEAASDALGDAIALKRSDQANLALLARRAAENDDADAVRATLAEFVLAWPTVIGAPGWDALLPEGVSTADVVDLAIDRWQHGLPTPEPLRGQPLWLSAVAGRDDLKTEAANQAGASSELADATFAVMRCEPDARSILRSISEQERESAAYWALRIQQAGEEGVSDLIARDVYRLLTNDSVTPESATRRMNALVEINAQGSVDAWGYHRGSIEWMDPRVALPLPEAGASRWLQDPVAARTSAGVQPGSCENS